MALIANTTSSLIQAEQPQVYSPPPEGGKIVHNKWPEPDAVSMNTYFGKIDLAEGDMPTDSWFKRFISRINLPWRCYASWDRDIRMDRLQLNTAVVPSLHRICARIINELGEAAAIENGLHLISRCGGYGLAPGKNVLSPHSWGCAISFDAERNPFKSEKPKTQGYNIDAKIIQFFKDEGWHWGGDNRWGFDPGTFSATSR